MDSPPWPDVEQVVIEYLTLATGTPASARLPHDLESELPRYRVGSVGGSDDTITDSAGVDVEAFASTRGEAHDLAEMARQAMFNMPANPITRSLVDFVTTRSRPTWVSYDNPKIQRFTSTFDVELRRPR
ncbi:hypothetical protein K0651_01860 [Ornithinimicrobium sp. Arc0846-15]|nr:hypothetical protein [Ornithinimicrobium laminariae]